MSTGRRVFFASAISWFSHDPASLPLPGLPISKHWWAYVIFGVDMGLYARSLLNSFAIAGARYIARTYPGAMIEDDDDRPADLLLSTRRQLALNTTL